MSRSQYYSNHNNIIYDPTEFKEDEAGFDHERIGETVERVGMKQFCEAVGLEPNIDMIARPRDNPYYKEKYED